MKKIVLRRGHGAHHRGLYENVPDTHQSKEKVLQVADRFPGAEAGKWPKAMVWTSDIVFDVCSDNAEARNPVSQ